MTDDASICRRCPHLGRSCHPPINIGGEVKIIDDETDPDLCEAIELVHVNGGIAKEVERAEKLIKEKLRGAETVLVNAKLLLKGRWRRGTVVPKELPPDLAAKKAEVDAGIDALKTKTDKGAWLWEVIPLGESDVKD